MNVELPTITLRQESALEVGAYLGGWRNSKDFMVSDPEGARKYLAANLVGQPAVASLANSTEVVDEKEEK